MDKVTKFFTGALVVILACSIIVGIACAQGYEKNTTNSTNASHWQDTSNALGVSGIVLSDGSVSFLFPITQRVSVDGVMLNDNTGRLCKFNFVPINAGLFAGNNTTALMTGYIPVPQTNLKNAAMIITNAGFNITAINQHLPRTDPAMSWIHICASGDPVAIATSLNNTSAAINGRAPAASTQTFNNTSLDTTQLDSVMKMNSTEAGGDYMYVMPTNITATLNGITLGAPDTMDAINFQPIGNGSVAVDGEFALTANEVEPMLTALSNNNIEVTAIHNHLIGEQPTIYYMHTWAIGDPGTIATDMNKAMMQTTSGALPANMTAPAES